MKELFKLIRLAGDLALREQEKLSITHKPDTSVVTNGDLAVSAFLEKELKKLYPDYDIFSEENTSKKPQSSRVLVIDPIDGTESYLRKQHSWSILVGFLEDNLPVGGVIYQPNTDLLYWGFKGQGAFVVSANETLPLTAQGEGEIKAVSSPKDYEEKKFLEANGIYNFLPLYSAALKIMEVAKGQADVYPNFRKKCSLWDLVAPEAILNEAGGKIIYEENKPVDFNNSLVDTRFCALGKRKLDLKL